MLNNIYEKFKINKIYVIFNKQNKIYAPSLYLLHYSTLKLALILKL